MGSFQVSPAIMVYETSISEWGPDFTGYSIKDYYDYLIYIEAVRESMRQ